MRIALALALVLSAAQSFAGTYSVTPTFVTAFTADGTFTEIPGYDLKSDVPAVIQLDLLLNVGDFTPDQLGFANGVFTVSFDGAGLSQDLGYNATVNNPNVDSNGAVPGGLVPLIGENADLAAQDLVDILIGVATPLTTNPAVDPRFQFGRGQFADFNIGTIYVNYDGTGQNFVNVAFTEAAALVADPAAPTRYLGIVDGSASLPVNSIEIGIPEPTTCVLAGLALVGVAARRRV